MIPKNVTLLIMLLATMMTIHVHADEVRTLRIGGIERSYLLHLPPGGTISPHPLLLLFHGGGGRARGMVKLTGIEPLADSEGFILAFPDGVRRHWHDGRISKKNKSKVDDVGFVAALLDELKRDYPIDHRRIAPAGMSNGAIFSERLGCDLTARFTVIIAVAGTLAADYAPQCHPSRPISVLLFSGDADPLVPYNGGKIADSDGGAVLSVTDTVTFWSHMDNCTGTQTVRELPQLAPHDPTSVTRISSDNCRDGSSVTLYSIAHGGHTWPGGLQYLPRFLIGPTTRQIDASAILLRFILDHPRSGG